MSMSVRQLKRGFTVVELMVVIVIIVALIAILMPVFAALRKTSQKTASKAQVTALSNACLEYNLTLNVLPGFMSEADIANTEYQVFTSSENLLISLLGGLSTGASTAATNGPGSMSSIVSHACPSRRRKISFPCQIAGV